MQCTFLFFALDLVSTGNFVFDIPQGALLSIDEKTGKFAPLGFRQLVARLLSSDIVHFIRHVHDKIDNA